MKTAMKLINDRLQVELDLPGRYYRGSRFDWTGFITQVTLDGAHTFCVPESLQPGSGSGGNGFCNEFGIDLPVGYDEIGPAELFPKLGIGLLRKPDLKAYDFSRVYEIVQPFKNRIESGVDWAQITSEPAECRGYAVRLIKQFHLQNNWLEINYKLENTGKKPILTHEYAHNFVGIDHLPVGPDYQLRLPYPVVLDPASTVGGELLEIHEYQISFKGSLSGLYLRPQGFSQTTEPQWEVALHSRHVGLREFDDFSPLRVAIWGTVHVISPEIFVSIAIKPGEVQIMDSPLRILQLNCRLLWSTKHHGVSPVEHLTPMIDQLSAFHDQA